MVVKRHYRYQYLLSDSLQLASNNYPIIRITRPYSSTCHIKLPSLFGRLQRIMTKKSETQIAPSRPLSFFSMRRSTSR